MAKVLKVNVSTTTIGMDNGEILEVDTSSINFIPKENDEVEVFKSDSTVYVNKIEKPVSSSVTNVYNINGAKPVNKITYALLAFFLGGLGAHKFYAGKIGKGIIYLIFSFTLIPAIIAFIEFIVALTKPADENGNIYV